jgi:LmbE family N-acetylglucosaminyl deacetylase
MENWFVPHFDSTLPPSKRALVLAPHPDDEVFGCAGASLALIQQGTSVQSIVFTNGCGEKTGDEKQKYLEQREYESREAAKILGSEAPEFLRFEDRALSQVNGLKDLIKERLLKHQPDLVFAPSLWEIHPDHRALAWGVLNALVECFEEKSLNITLFQYEVGSALVPNFILDFTPWMNRKDEAVKAFTSQLHLRNYEGCIKALNQYRTLTLRPESQRAEAFISVESKNIEEWLGRLSEDGMPNPRFHSDLAIVAADVQFNELQKDFNRYRDQVKQQIDTVHQLRMDLKSLKISLDESQKELANYRNLYNTIEQSRSWKITRPLRMLGQAMKKAKNTISRF